MICLTFDTDWMTEETLGRFLADFPLPGPATFFCHQPFSCLRGSVHEICPHPFISDLSNWQSPLAALAVSLGRPAAGVRPHSCVFSHMVGIGLRALGFQYVSQATALFQPALAPFRHPWGVWEMPIYYMDNMDFWTPDNWPDLPHRPFAPEGIARSLETPGLYVYDFHPIHLALNTPTAAYYQQVKHRVVNDGVSPFELAFTGRGTRDYFLDLCRAMGDAGQRSWRCYDALADWQGLPAVGAGR